MSFLKALDISASGMTAQRMRLDIASENITNASTTRTESGEPYRRKMVVFESVEEGGFRRALRDASGGVSAGGGVVVSRIIEDERDFKMEYDPLHPDADENGYVRLPNVDLIKETIDSMSAARSYDANLTAFNAIKLMAAKALEIGK